MTDTVLCTKADCRNLKQGTQARKANRNCTRHYCKQCCEVVGGCKVHQVTSVSSPVAAQQHIIPPLSTIDPMSTKVTFYKHRAAYQAAIKNSGDKVEHAVNAGYSPAGQWNTLLAEIKANTASLTGSNGPGSISNSDMKCHMLPPSLLPVDPSATDTGLQLPTDLTGEMSDALASLFRNIDDMHHDTAATTNSELPLDLTSYPQIDPFSACSLHKRWHWRSYYPLFYSGKPG
ncbi:hypothetical protein BDR07DRAFT_1383059 [Suillus spraguei]|nr:hypothetical protein BDR07DRAFT_1383059 [Suillus spraguei]